MVVRLDVKSTLYLSFSIFLSLSLYFFPSYPKYPTMQLLWAILIGSALASSIPDAHQLRLPFVPHLDNLENGVRSRLVSHVFPFTNSIANILT